MYSWNGQKYGKWDNPPQPPSNGILARNLLTASVHATITKNSAQTSFNYTYLLANDITSKQDIDEFRVRNSTASIQSASGRNFWMSSSSSGGFVSWVNLYFDANYIHKGESDGSFGYSSSGLPSIGAYYVRGHNQPPNIVIDTTFNAYQDILTNSVTGSTIIASDPPNSFNALAFLDSLSSDVTQSKKLNWIFNQNISDKYLGYFSTAKSQVQANSTTSARSTLQTVLSNVSADSTSNLSSEAYALIWYNTEYLLSQLSSSPSGFLVKLISSTGTYLASGSLQDDDGSWKNATNNNDGTFTINTQLASLSLRMTYAYGSQTVSNVPVGNNPFVFQTVNAQVKLQNSQGSLIDTGTVQYYAGAWRNFGTTSKRCCNDGTAAGQLFI